jgi:glycosyltransferase involved in cell wall biosynthesis
MRILIITQYFWPENFNVNDIASALKERGHEVIVLTGKPNYPKGKFTEGYSFFNKRIEFWRGLKILRSEVLPRGNGSGFKLFANYISFAFFASIRVILLRDKFDLIFVYEPSPITVGIPGIIAKIKFKAPMYLWVQDLWPESIAAAGGVKSKFILEILNFITVYIYGHCHKILVQSKAFIPYLINQNVEDSKILYYPNSTENFYKELAPDKSLMERLPKGLRLMFAGNIGEAQSFETLINTASILKNQGINIHWIILGDGRMFDFVKRKVNEENLLDCFHLFGFYPSSDMPKYFSCADALIVSLKKNPIFSRTIPSKIQSYLACGKPILTSLDGEGSRIIQEAKAGFASPSENPVALAENIVKFLSLSLDERKVLGMNARNYFLKEFERELLIDKLEYILQK